MSGIYKMTIKFEDGKSIFKAVNKSALFEILNQVKQTEKVVSAEVSNGQSSLKVYSGRAYAK